MARPPAAWPQPEAGNASSVGRYRAGGRDPRARSSGARSTKPAIASRSWFARISGAPSASRISICATPPTPTRRSRTPSSRCSPTSVRIAKRGRSRCGSRASSSMAASIAARRARVATAGSRRPRKRAPTRRGRAFGGAAPLDPEARLLARERRATAGGGDRSARRPAADRFHVVSLRRLHAARGERDNGVERIDRAGPPVPRGAEAPRPAGRKAVMGRPHHLAEDHLFECYTRRAGRRAARSAFAPSISPTAASAATRYTRTVALHGRPREATPTPRPTRSSRRSG